MVGEYHSKYPAQESGCSELTNDHETILVCPKSAQGNLLHEYSQSFLILPGLSPLSPFENGSPAKGTPSSGRGIDDSSEGWSDYDFEETGEAFEAEEDDKSSQSDQGEAEIHPFIGKNAYKKTKLSSFDSQEHSDITGDSIFEDEISQPSPQENIREETLGEGTVQEQNIEGVPLTPPPSLATHYDASSSPNVDIHFKLDPSPDSTPDSSPESNSVPDLYPNLDGVLGELGSSKSPSEISYPNLDVQPGPITGDLEFNSAVVTYPRLDVPLVNSPPETNQPSAETPSVITPLQSAPFSFSTASGAAAISIVDSSKPNVPESTTIGLAGAISAYSVISSVLDDGGDSGNIQSSPPQDGNDLNSSPIAKASSNKRKASVHPTTPIVRLDPQTGEDPVETKTILVRKLVAEDVYLRLPAALLNNIFIPPSLDIESARTLVVTIELKTEEMRSVFEVPEDS